MKTLVPRSGPACLGEVTAGGPIRIVASLYPLQWEIAPPGPPQSLDPVDLSQRIQPPPLDHW